MILDFGFWILDWGKRRDRQQKNERTENKRSEESHSMQRDLIVFCPLIFLLSVPPLSPIQNPKLSKIQNPKSKLQNHSGSALRTNYCLPNRGRSRPPLLDVSVTTELSLAAR